MYKVKKINYNVQCVCSTTYFIRIDLYIIHYNLLFIF